ncbi:amino acid permease [Naematelia encephala]|uniref:Amino acid permease n=1 Tax=Naematelia encephala TaxID=71784 RepID=A0A1Y2AQW4_9TREE|nr:amino acid permease [Naematelia encephala]
MDSEKSIDKSDEAQIAVLPGGDHASSSKYEPQLKRQMKPRHVSMIALGGTIGTGLFLSSGNALANGGPLGLVLGYALIGFVCFCVMTALGEMIAYMPIEGGIITLANRIVDPAFATALSFNYAYCYLFILPAEISAAAVLINYWITSVNNAVWITIGIVLVVGINLMGAKFYGETEFWFASIKVLTIVGLIIVSIVIDCGGGPASSGYVGFRYWKDPGPLNQYAGIAGAGGRFLGFWAVLIQAAFSFIGCETIAMTAGECKNPRRTISRAVKSIYVRIVLFYVLGMFTMGLVCPSNDPRIGTSSDAGASPFVIAIDIAGIKVLPSIVNACLLTSVLSAASADIYISSRTLYGVAKNGDLPKIVMKTTSRGLPIVAISISVCFALLSYMAVSSGATTVFNWFACAMAGITSWFSICVMYLRFRRALDAQGINRADLPYRGPITKFGCYFALVVIFLTSLTSAWSVFLRGNWDTATFVTNYLPMVLFPILYVAKKGH